MSTTMRIVHGGFAFLEHAVTVIIGLAMIVFGLGLGVTMLCSGFAFYFYRLIFGEPSQPPNVVPFQPVPIPVLSKIPIFGPVVFNQFALSYIAILLVIVATFVLNRTPWGLNLRTVGENPRAADAAGVNVAFMRYQALVLSGILMGIGGAYLSIAQYNAFTFGVISGRGWVAIALVVFGQWRPCQSALGALLFAFIDALQLRLQASGIIAIPYQAFLMMPFVLTIVAMAAVSRNARAPAALLIPFRKEER